MLFVSYQAIAIYYRLTGNICLFLKLNCTCMEEGMSCFGRKLIESYCKYVELKCIWLLVPSVYSELY